MDVGATLALIYVGLVTLALVVLTIVDKGVGKDKEEGTDNE